MKLIMTLGGLTLIATLTTVGLWAYDQRVAGAVVGAGAFFLWLGLLIVGTVAVTSWWTRQTMAAGAQLALRSQESDDRRDAIQIRAIADLAKILIRQSRDLPALPLPQQADWLPTLAEYEVGDGA